MTIESQPVVITAEQVSKLVPMRAAIESLAQALSKGLAPETTPARSIVPLDRGSLLLMPGEFGRYAGVKVLTVARENAAGPFPRIQGNYLLFDSRTLHPLALIDGIALTSLRTPAISAVAVDRLAEPNASKLVVFGTGPQARAHVDAMAAIRTLEHVSVVGRSPQRTDTLVAELRAAGFAADASDHAAVSGADIVACCTTARKPLFDGGLVQEHAVVVAMGSHEPDARETDDTLARRSTLYVEDVDTALREAGDVVIALANSCVQVSDLHTIADLVTAGPATKRSGPALVKTVGMGWQDLIVAQAAYERVRQSYAAPEAADQDVDEHR